MFKKFFSRDNKQPEPAGADDAPLRLALAALMVEAARADEHYHDKEKTIIDRFLAANFNISTEEAQQVRAQAEDAQSGAVDIQRFTKVAKEMPREEKIGFIEKLWEIVLSDGERDPYEDTLIRRICGLMYIEDRESGEARARVAAQLEAH